MNTDRIHTFIQRFPLFLPTVQKLDEHGIPWMIGGSGCLFLLGNARLPDDADIFLRDSDHDKADELFGITSFVPEGHLVRNSNPENNHDIQLTSHLRIIEDKEYAFSITGEILAKRTKLQENDVTLWLLPPEEVLILKAILQRGLEVGKYDFEDIDNYLANHSVDNEYLTMRIGDLGAQERIGTLLQKNNPN